MKKMKDHHSTKASSATSSLLKSAVAISFGMALMGASYADDKVVNVYNWSDYIDEEILTEFEAETGIKVNYDVFDSNELLETKLLTGGTGYDVVVPTGSFMRNQIKAGVFQEMDRSKLTNAGNLWDVIQDRTQFFDPGNVYSVNYMWGTTGLGYVKEAVDERIENPPYNSLALIFDPQYASKLADCGIHFLDSPTEIYPAMKTYLGIDPNSMEKADLEKVEAALMEIRPYIRKFHSSEYISALANGDICLAVGWSGDVLQARDRAAEADNGITVEYQIPKEGALMWFDQMAIPNDAPNVENAMTFIDYMLRADVAAKASNYVYYANGNKASQALLNEDVIGDTAIYPPQETIDNLYLDNTSDPKYLRLQNRSWTRVKSGQ